MKTLDEVIKGFECCENIDCGNCPYKILFNDDSHVPCDQFSKDEDALHYLKEYRNCGACAYADSYLRCTKEDRNDPLSWDELRQMEGKPVWVEELRRKYATPHWAIHNGIMDGYDGDENLYLQPFEVFTKNTLGTAWQAYRKERRNEDLGRSD